MLKRLLLALTLMLMILPFAVDAHDDKGQPEISIGLMSATEAAPTGLTGGLLLQKAPVNPAPTTPTNGIIAILIGRKNQITDGTSNTLFGS